MPETSPLTPELEAHIRKTQGGALLFKALLAELDACRAERDEQVYAVQKFLAASRHDLCHENRDELAHAFGLPSREYPRLPPEGEFALRCVEYRQELYGADGPGSEAEVFAAELARLRASIAWRCSSCGCAFPDHPSLSWPPELQAAAMEGVTRCTNCVQLEVLAAEAARRLSSLTAALADLDAARGVLREVEWAGDPGSESRTATCPACEWTHGSGHAPGCPLARALSGGPTNSPGTPPGPSGAPGSGGPPSGP